jgi:hypothetical protein
MYSSGSVDYSEPDCTDPKHLYVWVIDWQHIRNFVVKINRAKTREACSNL